MHLYIYACMDIIEDISINLLCMYVCMNEFIGVKSAWRLQTVTSSTQKTRFVYGYIHTYMNIQYFNFYVTS